MLEKLPWPKHLARVPEFAGGHHERMDGKGYPRGLTREQMSLQARMMGIADIFEVGEGTVIHDHRGPPHRADRQTEFRDEIPEGVIIDR